MTNCLNILTDLSIGHYLVKNRGSYQTLTSPDAEKPLTFAKLMILQLKLHQDFCLFLQVYFNFYVLQ